MLRLTNAKSVVCECRKAILIDCNISVGIVEVVEWQIPITAIEAHTMSQDLNHVGGPFRW